MHVILKNGSTKKKLHTHRWIFNARRAKTDSQHTEIYTTNLKIKYHTVAKRVMSKRHKTEARDRKNHYTHNFCFVGLIKQNEQKETKSTRKQEQNQANK